MMNAKHDYLVKILLVGDREVGKTALLIRLCNDEFPKTYFATIEMEVQFKTISCDDKKLKMQIWDASGQERYRSIVSKYYRGAMGIILVYAVDDRNSFQNVPKWLQQIKNKATPEVIIALVGNKCDIKERVVSYEEGKEIADKNGLIFFETSVKEGIYVDELFHQVGNDIYKRLFSEIGE